MIHKSALAAIVKESSLLSLVVRTIVQRHNTCLIHYHARSRLDNALKIPLFAAAWGRIVAIFDHRASSGLNRRRVRFFDEWTWLAERRITRMQSRCLDLRHGKSAMRKVLRMYCRTDWRTFTKIGHNIQADVTAFVLHLKLFIPQVLNSLTGCGRIHSRHILQSRV